MLQRLRQAGLVWPTALGLAGLAVLVGLGTWQLERKRWKDDLIAKITARVSAPPQPIERAAALLRRGDDIEYLHVAARGRFHHGKERYLYAPTRAGLGWHVYTPLELAPQRFVWVNRGTVPDDRKAPALRAQGQMAGEVALTGLVRTAMHPGAFTPNNDVAHNLWFWPDLAAMSASAFTDAGVETLPFGIDADARPAPPGGLPQGGATRLALPNRHLEYALTWYGIAMTLVGVYAAFALGRLRLPASKP